MGLRKGWERRWKGERKVTRRTTHWRRLSSLLIEFMKYRATRHDSTRKQGSGEDTSHDIVVQLSACTHQEVSLPTGPSTSHTDPHLLPHLVPLDSVEKSVTHTFGSQRDVFPLSLISQVKFPSPPSLVKN